MDYNSLFLTICNFQIYRKLEKAVIRQPGEHYTIQFNNSSYTE